ncbi:MAG TPA: fluoride efflux transporter CrcB [Ottowia sp.]|uniref:fluoride efflux transporter CrcB n=1 Tax=Ottowia sp. TaxID=1898956 RepID=UPI002CC8931E|nr:fluoride efflux transporter CrcB [Ottowia sp.]HMN22377.1 fluoride efflux transporter CrcB [Ottowia sp.]
MPPVVAICLGACIGALARWRLGLWLNHDGHWLPWGTLAANLIGGYLVGIAVTLIDQQPLLHPAWRLFWITGLLGALTTFSSFSAEVVEMLMLGRWAQAGTTALAHLAGSLLLTWAGIRTASLFLAVRA